MSISRKRFYRQVSLETVPIGAEPRYRILLDGKPVKTPLGAALAVPTHALAEALAAEWRAQENIIRPETMILTKLANTAIDRVAADRAAAVEQILAFGRTDVVCYRAEAPSDLLSRQSLTWDPLIQWARERFGAELRIVTGITFVEQNGDALLALRESISARDAFLLAALGAASALCGSLVIALAFAEGKLDSEQAFGASHLDEIFQAEKWGRDSQAAQKAQSKRTELAAVGRFIELLKDV